MLTYDYTERISGEACLKHEWFNKMAKQEVNPHMKENTSNSLKNMKNFVTDCKFQHAVLLYVVHFYDLKMEKENILSTFEKQDLNGDGQITREELMQGYIENDGNEDAKAEVNKIFDKVDIDKNNNIDFTEFCLATIDHKKIMNEEKMNEVFRLIDTDSSGQIDVKELKEFFSMGDTNESDEFIQDLINEADLNGDGLISIDEFRIMMNLIIEKV